MSKDLKDIGENELENNIKLPEQEEVLMNEEELLNGLLEAANHRDSGEYHHKIQIKRNGGKVLFEFKIRPITEEEMQECRNSVTKYRPDPRGRQFPKIEYDVDYVKLRSQKIIKATVDEGKGILWDNKILKDKLGVLQAADVIDYVLLGGEKDHICDKIDEISGYGEYTTEASYEEIAKN